MIFEFTYTECTSPGPFKKETGFKVKSARVYKVSGELGSPDLEAFDVEDDRGVVDQDTLGEIIANSSKIEAATTHLGGYNAPPIGPFSSPEEFASITKGFIYTLVRFPEGKWAWLLARLSTSGPANGRPGNPFHQGILVLDKASKAALIRHAVHNSRLEDPRPIDLLTWNGWLNPRGDVQVDSSNLRSSDLPHPVNSAEDMSLEHSHHIAYQGEAALDVFSAAARSFMRGMPVPVPGVDSEEFRRWVSVLSHLIPSSVSWFCGFGSTWRGPAPTLQEVGLPQFYWTNERVPEDQDVEAWAYLASKTFEYDLDLLVYDRINQVDKSFNWTREEHMSYALMPLPLSLLGLPAEDFGDEGPEIAEESARLLLRTQWPRYRGDSKAFEELWESLEMPESLFNSLEDRTQLESKLDLLIPLPKDQA